MENLTQVYILASDGFVFDMDKINNEQLIELQQWSLKDSDEISGFKMAQRGEDKQIILRIPGLEYNESTLTFFTELHKQSK